MNRANNMSTFIPLAANPYPKDTSLDELLDKLGFDKWKTITSFFILSIVNLLGLVFCSLNLWIFSRNFVSNVFPYFSTIDSLMLSTFLVCLTTFQQAGAALPASQGSQLRALIFIL
jgi:hypothetical protein